MSEHAYFQVKEAVASHVDEIDKSIVRSVQRFGHLCAAKCCEDEEAHVTNFHKCIENCATSIIQAQDIIHTELFQFKDSLTKCLRGCQAKAIENVSASSTDDQISVSKIEFGHCVMECVDEHISLLPSIRKRMSKLLPES